MDLTFLKAEGHSTYVLKIQVEKSQSVHKTSDGSVYERKGAQSLPVTDPVRMTALAFAKGAVSYEDFSVDTAMAEDVVDSPRLAEFLADYSPTSDPLELALNKNLIDRKSFSRKWQAFCCTQSNLRASCRRSAPFGSSAMDQGRRSGTGSLGTNRGSRGRALPPHIQDSRASNRNHESRDLRGLTFEVTRDRWASR